MSKVILDKKNELFEKRMAIKIENFIDGQFLPDPVDPQIGQIESYNPSNGEINALLPNSNVNDVNLAANAALNAFEKY